MASLIIGGVGGVFLITGGVLRGVDTQQETTRVSAIPLATPASWKSLAPGTTVLVEGRIASTTPTRFRDFVACTRQRYAGRETTGTSKGRPHWEPLETLAPPLSLEAPGGAVALTGGYQLPAPCHQWEDEDPVTVAFNTRGDTASGFHAGDAVLAEGRVTEQGLAATNLRCGNREDYLEATRSNAEVPGLLGLIFLIVGGVLALVAGGVAWLGRAK